MLNYTLSLPLSNLKTKNQRRKKKKKRRNAAKRQEQELMEEGGQSGDTDVDSDPGVEVEYVPEAINMSDPAVRQFSRIFEAFQVAALDKKIVIQNVKSLKVISETIFWM